MGNHFRGPAAAPDDLRLRERRERETTGVARSLVFAAISVGPLSSCKVGLLYCFILIRGQRRRRRELRVRRSCYLHIKDIKMHITEARKELEIKRRKIKAGTARVRDCGRRKKRTAKKESHSDNHSPSVRCTLDFFSQPSLSPTDNRENSALKKKIHVEIQRRIENNCSVIRLLQAGMDGKTRAWERERESFLPFFTFPFGSLN